MGRSNVNMILIYITEDLNKIHQLVPPFYLMFKVRKLMQYECAPYEIYLAI
jgi:hypothetical protein